MFALLRNPDGVERDIDSRGFFDDVVDVIGHGILVERVDLGGLDRATGSRDLLGERVERAEVSSGQKQPGAFPSEGPRHRAPNRARGPVDDRVLVFQQHDVPPIHR